MGLWLAGRSGGWGPSGATFIHVTMASLTCQLDWAPNQTLWVSL